MPVAFFERLEFCPSCKTSYESTRQSQFSRVASLGTEGRAGAVTVLSQSVVRALRTDEDLDGDARKFLAFSDNRQDAPACALLAHHQSETSYFDLSVS